MRRIFESPAWKTFKDWNTVYKILGWFGLPAIAMALISAIVTAIWTPFKALPGALRFVVAMAAFLVALGVVAVCQLVFVRNRGTRHSLAGEPSGLVDRHGKPIITADSIPVFIVSGRKRSRLIAALVIALALAVALYTGSIDALVA